MEEVPNTLNSLFWAYSAVWFILGAYIFSLIRRLDKLEQEVREKL